MLAGRLPSQDAPQEIAVDQIGAQQLRLHVGSVLRMAAMDSSNHVRPLTEHVVGVFVTRGSVVPVTYLDQVPQIMGSLALFRELGPAYVGVRRRVPEAEAGRLRRGLHRGRAATRKRYPATGKQVFVADEATQAATIERPIRPQAVALALFALALALTALLIIGQVAARTLQAAAQDNGTLAALGMTRRQLFTASMAETAAATVAGALGAVAIAIAVSPLTPIGPARLAEPDPGVSVNAGVLAAGAAAIVVLLAARVAVTAWRQAGARPAADLAEAVAAPPAARRAAVAGRRAARRRHRRAVRARPGNRPRQRPGAQRHARPRDRGRRGRRRGHVRREPAAPGRHAEPVRPGLGHRVRRAVRHHHAEAVQPAHRPRARHHRRDVRHARHGHHRQDRDPGDRPGAGNRPDDVLDRARPAARRPRAGEIALGALGAARPRAAGRPDGARSARRLAPARC